MKPISTLLFSFLSILSIGFDAHATHLRAGEITARRISSTALTYEITVTTYHDEGGGQTASAGQKDVDLCIKPFGTGFGTTFKVPRIEFKIISKNTSRNIFRTTYTFPSPGRFVINCGIRNRNENVINVKTSIMTPFYLETILEIDRKSVV